MSQDLGEDTMDAVAEDEEVPKEKNKEVFSLESILWTVRNTTTR